MSVYAASVGNEGIEPILRRPATQSTESVATVTGLRTGVAKPTELEQLKPVDVAPTRPSKFWNYFVRRDWGFYDSRLTGHRATVEQTGASSAPLQDMASTDKYRLNTFRVMPEPWDEGLYS